MNRYRYTKILKDNNKTRFRSITNYPKITPKNSDKTYYSKEGDIYKAVYAYNHADNYVMAVLELTEKIRKRVALKN